MVKPLGEICRVRVAKLKLAGDDSCHRGDDGPVARGQCHICRGQHAETRAKGGAEIKLEDAMTCHCCPCHNRGNEGRPFIGASIGRIVIKRHVAPKIQPPRIGIARDVGRNRQTRTNAWRIGLKFVARQSIYAISARAGGNLQGIARELVRVSGLTGRLAVRVVENIVIKIIAVGACKIIAGRRTQVIKNIVVEIIGMSVTAVVNVGWRKICRRVNRVIIKICGRHSRAVPGKGKDIALVVSADIISNYGVGIFAAGNRGGGILDK